MRILYGSSGRHGTPIRSRVILDELVQARGPGGGVGRAHDYLA